MQSASNPETSNLSPSAPAGRIAFLDDMRGMAIIAVFLFHCMRRALGQQITPATFGGVAMFFVLSGFCIHLTFCRGARKNWRAFYTGRFFRIYPPYLAALLLFAFLFPTTRLSFHRAFDWAQLGSHLSLVHNLNHATLFGVNPAFWSIAVEAQLYLLYPLLLMLAAGLGWRGALYLLAAVALALRAFGGVGENEAMAAWRASWHDGLPVFYWFSWALGAAAADAYLEGRKAFLAGAWVSLWLAAAVATSIVRPLAPLSFLFYSVFTAAAIAKLLAQGRRAIPALPDFLSRHLKFAGVRSYSFYLLHLPLILAAPRVLKKLGFEEIPPLLLFGIFLAMYPPILGCAMLFRKYIELPSAAYGKSFLQTGPRAPGTADAVLTVPKTGASPEF